MGQYYFPSYKSSVQIFNPINLGVQCQINTIKKKFDNEENLRANKNEENLLIFLT